MGSMETINAQDRYGRTAVYCAAHSNLLSTIMLLQDHGADVHLRPFRYAQVKASTRERLLKSRREWKDDADQQMAVVLTILTTPAKVGDTKLDVANADDFEVGRTVTIDAGTVFEEDNQIAGFDSMQLLHPLQYEHGAGATISNN